MREGMTPSDLMTGPQVDKAVATYRAMLEKFAPEYSQEAVQAALGRKQLAHDQIEVFRKHVEVAMNLAPRGIVELTLDASHVPQDFYQTREGLWVWDGYKNQVSSKAQPTQVGAKCVLKRAELVRNLTDEQIELALGDNHIFDVDTVCWTIAVMIAEQPNGKEGKLLNNGYANLFYLSGCVVRVYWSAGFREWNVNTYVRVGRKWYAGRRAFSPADQSVP